MTISENVFSRVSRRRALAIAGAAALAPLALPARPASAAGGVPLVVNGGARAAVVVGPSAHIQIRFGAQELVEHIRRASTATVPLSLDGTVPAGWSGTVIRIRLAETDAERAVFAGHNETSYLIDAAGQTITITSMTVLGARWGVYDLLERFVDVRWLLPGSDGTDVPTNKTIFVSPGKIFGEPDFYNRALGPSTTTSTVTPDDHGNLWAGRQRTHSRYGIGHALWNLVPVAKYGTPGLPTYREDFYPIWNGQRYIPPAGLRNGWQPRFSAPGLADAIANEVMLKFASNPTLKWVSLGVNDGACASDDELAGQPINSTGYPTLSEVYYSLVNDVTDRVHAHLPDDVLITLYAYQNVTDAPSFRLHPRVVPSVCMERYGWVDPELAAEDRKRINDWCKVSDRVEIYDYTYGSCYYAPRIYTEALGAALRFGKAAGAWAVSSETYPVFAGEGAKTYLFGRQLWDSTLDVRDEFKDWCERAVGKRAGVPLWMYYRQWESFWSNDVRRTDWFDAHTMLFNFNAPDYLDLLTPETMASRRTLLDTVVRLADSPERITRAKKIRREFDYYEASALSYPRQTRRPESVKHAHMLLDDAISTVDTSVELAARRMTLIDEFASDPAIAITNYRQKWAGGAPMWSGWNFYPLWDIADYIAAHRDRSSTLLDKLGDIAANHDHERARQYASWLLAAADGRIVELGQNMSFEDTVLDPWTWNSDPAFYNADVRRDLKTYRTGTASLRIPPNYRGFFRQADIPVTPGPIMLQLYARANSASRNKTRYVYFFIDIFAGEKRINRIPSKIVTVKNIRGRWHELRLAEMIPDTATTISVRVEVGTDVDVYFDSARIRQIGSPM